MAGLEQDVAGYLTGEADGDLAQWRLCQATINAVHSNPEAFSRQETIAAHLTELVLLGTYYAMFRIDPKASINVNAASGAIYILPPMGDDEEDE